MNTSTGSIASIVMVAIGVIIGLVVISKVTYSVLFSGIEVTGMTMHPNYINGERYLVNKIIYKFSEPQRGDVVQVISPLNNTFTYLKRIIAVPNETIAIKDNIIFINDMPIDETAYISSDVQTFSGGFFKNGEKYTIPSNSYVVMGDNRIQSLDSREFGYITKNNIIGKISRCLNNCSVQ